MATLDNKTIVFRADASHIIGAGHIMRCLTLADALSAIGVQCYFICRAHQGSLQAHIQTRGYCVYTLPHHNDITPVRNHHSSWIGATWEQDAQDTISVIKEKNIMCDWLFIDHYGIDSRWHNTLKPYTQKIAVIDDLADRSFECDLLIDQLCHRHTDDYLSRVKPDTQLLLGGRYAILRPVFAELRNESLIKRKQLTSVKRVFISMGGTDLLNATHTALNIIANSVLSHKVTVDILLGQQSEHYHSTYDVNDFPFTIHIHPVNTPIHELMLAADIAIGAGGSTAWERCCLGIPTFLMTIAQNQHDAAKGLMEHNAAIMLGDMDNFNFADASALFNKTVSDISALKQLTTHAAEICDGNGCQRIINKITSMTI